MDETMFAAETSETEIALEPAPRIGQEPYEFLTGPAGTGKTFMVKDLAAASRSIVLCATTGIASINLGAGETINAFGKYFDTASLQQSFTLGYLTATLGRHWRAGVRRIVLDEVSMFSADQLTIWVRALEELAARGYVLKGQKGGWALDDEDEDEAREQRLVPAIGLTLTGDFCQLAPIKAAYTFTSPEWERFAPHVTTLTTIRRQTDQDFIRALQACRRGQPKSALDYFAGRLQREQDDHFEGPTLFAKNDSVDRFNQLRLDKLPGAPVEFRSSRWGKQRSEWGNPEKPESTWGIPPILRLKIGALVMILSNKRRELSNQLLYANGDLGEVVEAEGQRAWIKLHRTGQLVAVDPITREVKIPADAARRKELRLEDREDLIAEKYEITGSITYMPLRVAYAATVHKSQGLSLDQVQVNLGDSFFRTPGMVYVALSRARTAEGLRIVGSEGAFAERCTADPKLAAWL